MTELVEDESVRAVRLLDAQAKAEALFDAVADRGLIAPGELESSVSGAIRDLAADLLGVSRYWHKRIVRAGANTLLPYRENPPDLTLGEDDIVFCDFGPIFEEWEADFGRTFVLGGDPVKHRLNGSLPVIFDQGRAFFEDHPDITGAELYAHVQQACADAGWTFGGHHAGHLIGQFPHEKIAGDDTESYITSRSDEPMRRHDRTGRLCHWILEIHLIEPGGRFGGFYEELLDLRA